MATKTGRSEDVYLLPNLFTSGNLFFGFYSIIASLNGSFKRAGFAILIAAVFDLLDGRIARLTKSYSKFGEEYDSLADMVSFGVAPPLLIYLWSGLGAAPLHMSRWGWLASFLFLACGALRLSRFNIHPKKRDFLGLPIPAAATVLASGVLLYLALDLTFPREILSLGVLVALAFFMVSSLPYKSYKDLELKQRRPFPVMVILIILVSLMIIRPEAVIFSLSVAYVLSGGILGLFNKDHATEVKKTAPKIHLIRPVKRKRHGSK
ncbi:CDP-diacylglycerol--serine O-phosphatidyltransferase [Bdellovibrionota bacterium]